MNDTPKAITPESASLYAYLLLRTDMPSLGRGKGAAHAMHAGNHMTHELWVRPLLEGRVTDPRVETWHAQGGGFGTTITLGKTGQITLDVIDRVVSAANTLGLLAGAVRDTSYPYIVDDEILPLIRQDVHTRPPKRIRDGWLCCRDEITAAWLMGDKDDLGTLLARFDLASND